MKGGRRSAKASAAKTDGADPRFIQVAKALAEMPGVELTRDDRFNPLWGLIVNRAVLGLLIDGRFHLRLTADRAAALIAEGVGRPYSPYSRPVAEGWIRITDPAADWVGLAIEAYRLATS